MKRIIYLFSFIVLGLLFGFLVLEVVYLIYTNLLLSNFDRYSFGLSWLDLMQFQAFFGVLVLFVSGLWGYYGGKYWWRQIYVLKNYRKRYWRRLFSKT